MKKFRFLLVIAMLVSLLLGGCAVTDLFAKETVPPTEAPTEAPTAEPTEAPTEAPTEPPVEVGAYRLTETVFPETDKATGTLKFYINDAVIYAGVWCSTNLSWRRYL